MAKEKIINGDRAYILGFGTLALALFLGYHWSPDYNEFFLNGNNFLFIVGFSAVVFIITLLIDIFYKPKNKMIKE